MREGREGGIESDRDSDMEIDRLEKLPLLQFSTLSDGFDVCEADGPFINPSRSQALGSDAETSPLWLQQMLSMDGAQLQEQGTQWRLEINDKMFTGGEPNNCAQQCAAK